MRRMQSKTEFGDFCRTYMSTRPADLCGPESSGRCRCQLKEAMTSIGQIKEYLKLSSLIPINTVHFVSAYFLNNLAGWLEYVSWFVVNQCLWNLW
ncbi:hypothetical protein SDJN02_09217 [Cucurbita argyrosperma subsp. argyrosperma]|nr:hypothetical protein SDJN02_09217 [Cucurbita argyrosperma subsp. argyrosperma]